MLVMRFLWYSLTFWAAMTAGGYAVAAGTGAVALNESYAIGSGTNVLLETAFNGDIQAYETTSMMIDLLGMGIVQCGIDNAALGQKRKGVYVNTVDDIIKGVEDGSIPLTNNTQKGNYGEMKMDAYFKSQGYERISFDRVTDLNTPTHQGIDGVYYNSDGHPPYIIGEAKYGSSRLSTLADGTPQMSDKWIIDRLENAVGEKVANDIKMEMILNPDNVGSSLVHVSPDGGIDITELIDGIKQ